MCTKADMFSPFFGGQFETPKEQNELTRFLIIDLPDVSHEFWFDRSGSPRLMHGVRKHGSDEIDPGYASDEYDDDDAIAAAIVKNSIFYGYEPALSGSALRRCLRACVPWLRGDYLASKCAPCEQDSWQLPSVLKSGMSKAFTDATRTSDQEALAEFYQACKDNDCRIHAEVRPLTDAYLLYSHNKEKLESLGLYANPDEPPRGLHKQ